MSIVKTYSVFCEGTVAAPGPAQGSPCPEWEVHTTEGADAARRMAKRLGWTRKSGRDLCPACSREAAEAATPDRVAQVTPTDRNAPHS